MKEEAAEPLGNPKPPTLKSSEGGHSDPTQNQKGDVEDPTQQTHQTSC